MNVAMNKKAMKVLIRFRTRIKPLSAEDFEAMADETGALILDTRPAAEFHKKLYSSVCQISE